MHRIALVFLLASWTLGANAAGPEALTPEHLTRLRAVLQATISPTGSHVAYVLAVPRKLGVEDDGVPWTELHVVDPAGKSRPFVTGEAQVSDIAWTPDGSSIAFLAKRGKDEHKSLYLIPVDGGEARRVVSHATDITAFSLAPDGKRVAFLAAETEPKTTGELKKKGFSQEIFEESWRPVQVWIAELTEGTPKKLELAGSASELHWSPAGDRLTVALAPTPSVDDGYMNRKVHVVDTEGKVIARFDNPGKIGETAWCPDGSGVAMLSAADRNDPAAGRLMLGTVSSGSLQDLIPDYQGSVADLAWTGRDTLLAIGDEGVQTLLKRVKSSGDAPTEAKSTDSRIVLSVDVTRDGRSVVLVTESPEHPAEVYLVTPDEKTPRRLTDSNPWLKDIRFAEREVVRFKARDGLELEGILIRPLDAEKGKRYPLILSVHGGPESHDRNGFLTSYSLPGQVAAARGFAVFYPNYRGSTGRGVAFSKLGQKDPAGKEFDDLVDAVDHLVAQGIADKAKVGITGGSYGGYASAWGATYYSERFAASVMFVGISDKIAKSGTTDIPEEEYLVHARRRPWEDWDALRQGSPVFHVTKSKTPILILHGKDDPRVHPSQSLELYRYLKIVNQAPVRLVLYPGEGHGNRRAASRYDYNLRMLQWFEHYLKGGGEKPKPEMEYPALKP